MKKSLSNYKSLVFDCDGVVLNSNKVKTQAFYKSTLVYGELAAQSMVKYHVANGGVSRYKKFAYFLEQIVPTCDRKEFNLDYLLRTYAFHVLEGLVSCEIAFGLEKLRQQTAQSRWFIVSGGDQNELREVFARRNIAQFFDGGIFGSPDNKDHILSREICSDNIQNPALFLGDSKYDYQAASKANIDFIFISDWSEVADWPVWLSENKIAQANNLHSLI